MFEFSRAINNIADRIVSVPGFGRIIKNPIYTALLITVCIILIILYIFRNAETVDSLIITALRGGFYIFIFLTGVIFLHNHVLMNEVNSAVKGGEGIFDEVLIDPLENDKIHIAHPGINMIP
jgi:hypothetical protein